VLRLIGDERLVDQIGERHAADFYAYGYGKVWRAHTRAGKSGELSRVETSSSA
jgi:hypothetical protein